MTTLAAPYGSGPKVRASEIKVGDVLLLWTENGKPYSVKAIVPYRGPLAYLWPEGVRSATFAAGLPGITLGNNELWEIVVP